VFNLICSWFCGAECTSGEHNSKCKLFLDNIIDLLWKARILALLLEYKFNVAVKDHACLIIVAKEPCFTGSIHCSEC